MQASAVVQLKQHNILPAFFSANPAEPIRDKWREIRTLTPMSEAYLIKIGLFGEAGVIQRFQKVVLFTHL
jgi:hypothetical protein